MTRGFWPDREYCTGIARHEHPEEGQCTIAEVG